MQDHLHAPERRRGAVQYRRRTSSGTLLSHAVATTGAVLALAGRVIVAALRARLVSPARAPELFAPRRRPARDRAVAVAAIAAPADLELAAALAAATDPKLLHPSSRAEEVSTGDPSPIIIPTETKRLHPRGDSVPAESPVSSTSERERQAGPIREPVSGRAQIPRTRALATIVRPRSAGIVSNWEEAEMVEASEVASEALVAPVVPGAVGGDPFRFERTCDVLVDLVHHFDVANVRPTYLGTKMPRQCSLCGRQAPEASFRKIAHVIPEAFGNRSILTYDECDDCNERAGRELENELAMLVAADRVIGRIPTKGGGTAKAKLGKGRSGVGGSSRRDAIPLEIVAGDPSITVSMNSQNAMTITFPPVKVRPLYALRSFIKTVWQALPLEARARHEFVRRLATGEVEILPARFFRVFFPGVSFPMVRLTIWEGDGSDKEVPPLVALLTYGATALVWCAPSYERRAYGDAVLPPLFRSAFPPHVPTCVQVSITEADRVTIAGTTTTFGFRSALLVYAQRPIEVTLALEDAKGGDLSAILTTPNEPSEPIAARALYRIEGGSLAGSVEIETTSQGTRWAYEFTGGGQVPGDVLRSLTFVERVLAGEALRVVETSSGRLLFRMGAGESAATELSLELRSVKELAGMLHAINEAFGACVPFPSTPPTPDEVRVIELLYGAALHGAVGEPVPPEGVSLILPREMAEQLLARVRSGPTSLEADNALEYFVCGVRVDPGPAVLQLREAFPRMGVAALEEELLRWRPGEVRQVVLDCSKMVHVFPHRLPDAT